MRLYGREANLPSFIPLSHPFKVFALILLWKNTIPKRALMVEGIDQVATQVSDDVHSAS
jgi:hypothetical protein